jgi:predicted RNA polymerase sigma factor
VLQTALTRDRLGEFQAQAAIAALHADARTAEETDWVQIVEWYDELVRLTDSPVARLNGPSRSARPTARGPAWPPWPSSTPPCPATPPPRRTCTSVTVTQ